MDYEALERRRMAELRREIEPAELPAVLQKALDALGRVDQAALDSVDRDYLLTATMRLSQGLNLLDRVAGAA